MSSHFHTCILNRFMKSVPDLRNGIHFVLAIPVWLIHVSQTRLHVLGGLVHGWWQTHIVYISGTSEDICKLRCMFVHVCSCVHMCFLLHESVSVFVYTAMWISLSLCVWHLSLLPGMPWGPSAVCCLQPRGETQNIRLRTQNKTVWVRHRRYKAVTAVSLSKCKPVSPNAKLSL